MVSEASFYLQLSKQIAESAIVTFLVALLRSSQYKCIRDKLKRVRCYHSCDCED